VENQDESVTMRNMMRKSMLNCWNQTRQETDAGTGYLTVEEKDLVMIDLRPNKPPESMRRETASIELNTIP
jgi:hypothetical protein